jgi:regulatory protein
VRKSKPEQGHGAALGTASPTARALPAGGDQADIGLARAADAARPIVDVGPAETDTAVPFPGDPVPVPDSQVLDFATLRRELEALNPARRTSRTSAPGATREAPPPADPYRKAMGLLVRREHSRRELTRKLGTRDAEPGQVQAALDKLAGQGYQDDARFAEMLVRTRLGGGYGPQYIRAELGMHGLAGEAISAALREAEPDWPALAREALRRRYGERPARDRAESLKRAHFLQRRGFDLDSIRAATAAKPED